MVELIAWITAPMMNRISAARMTRFRPRLSARTDANGEIRSAKREVHDVMMDLSREVRGLFDRAVPMDTRVADITPVSSGCVS